MLIISLGTIAYRGSFFGSGTGPIFIDNLDCSDENARLLDCGYSAPIGIHQCDHSRDAGVACLGKIYCSGVDYHLTHLVLTFIQILMSVY